MRLVIFSLLLYFMAIKPSEYLQLTDKLEAQIAELNKKIAPIAIFTNGASTTINGLLQDFESSLQFGFGIGPANWGNSIFTSLSYILALLISWTFKPFTPATDNDGKLKCVSKFQDNFCTEDASYPKWFTTLIETEVAVTLTDLLPPVEINPCGTYNGTSKLCNTEPNVLSVKSLEVISTKNQPGARNLGMLKEYNFVLQTKSFQQVFTKGVCKPLEQNCTGASLEETYRCKQVGPAPYDPVRRSEGKIAVNALVIDQQGVIAVKETALSGPCFCICDVP